MLTARTRFTGAAVNGKIYAIGGEPNTGGDYSIVEEYDPTTNTWTPKTPMPTPRTSLTSSVVNDKIYVIGGFNLSTVEEYDPSTDTWTNCGDPAPGNICAPMPTGRSALTSSAVNGKIYAIGGTSGGVSYYLDTVEENDPATNTWTNCGGLGCASMPTARRFLASSVANEKIYAIGGQAYESTEISTVEEFTPPSIPTPEASKEITDGEDRLSDSPMFDVFVGDVFEYTITIENPFEQAYLRVSDTLDAALDYVLGSFMVNGTPAGYDPFVNDELLYDTNQPLNAGETLSLSFQVEVQDVPMGTLIDNTAVIMAYTNPSDIPGTTLAEFAAIAPQAHVVPEPATLLLFGIGMIGILTLVRRRLKK
jgi:fimbrial isopeptide formation D2 family protein